MTEDQDLSFDIQTTPLGEILAKMVGDAELVMLVIVITGTIMDEDMQPFGTIRRQVTILGNKALAAYELSDAAMGNLRHVEELPLLALVPHIEEVPPHGGIFFNAELTFYLAKDGELSASTLHVRASALAKAAPGKGATQAEATTAE